MTDGQIILLLSGQAALALFAMWRVAVIDFLQFEIDPAWLLVFVLSGLTAVIVNERAHGLPDALAVGGIAAGATALVVWLRPGQIGRGDIWLMGAIGVIAGPLLLPPLMVVLVIFAAAVSAGYSRARGKRLFRSGFPLALPAMAAAVPIVLVQFAAAIWPDSSAAHLLKFNIITIIGTAL